MYWLMLLAMMVLAVADELRVSDFNPGVFKSSQPRGSSFIDVGFWQVFTGTYDSTGQLLMAYSDINGDK